MEKQKNILIVCGEASGDVHASRLVREIKTLYPSASFFGLGGPLCEKQGVRLLFDLVHMAVVGFFEVIKHLKVLKKIFNDTLAETDKIKPDLAILVDYPGFNLRLARQLRARNIPVAYYISPQIWAWGKKRIHLIKECVSRMIVFFPFEKELYEKAGVPVSFIGHPLLDYITITSTREAFMHKHRIPPADKIIISLLPGSRHKEIKTLLHVMLETAKLIDAQFPNMCHFLILAAPTIPTKKFERALRAYNFNCSIVSNENYNALAASDFALVCSGTATLETGIVGTPMCILYKLNALSFALIRALIRIPYIGLVNVVAGKKIAEEFIQYDCTPQRIARYVVDQLENKKSREKLRADLADMKQKLGEPGASKRAAEVIVAMLK
jgi:lipid-A-disaccharide synthase